MDSRVKFCMTIIEMFKSGEIDEKKMVFPTRLIFDWMDMSINKITGFQVQKIPIFSYKNLFIQKR